MDLAWEQTNNAGHGAAVIALDQTAGHGRFGRTWVSAPGASLTMSVVVHSTGALTLLPDIVCGVAVVRAIHRLTGATATIKWPNDVRLDGKKVCGILVIGRIDTQGHATSVVGIGLNLGLDFERYPELREVATSLAAATGRHVSVNEAAEAVLDALDLAYSQAKQGQDLHSEWRAMLDMLGERVTARAGEHVDVGMAEDVAPDGALVLRHDDGSIVLLSAGEVTLSGPKA